jgi:hypothetical protein
MAAQLDINSLIGPSAMGPNYKTATSQGEANALNAQGYQLVPGGTTERADGSGTWTMYQMGPSPTKITNSLLGRYVDMYNAVPGDMASLGASQSREIDENAARMAAAANQSATSRGLTNNSALFFDSTRRRTRSSAYAGRLERLAQASGSRLSKHVLGQDRRTCHWPCRS